MSILGLWNIELTFDWHIHVNLNCCNRNFKTRHFLQKLLNRHGRISKAHAHTNVELAGVQYLINSKSQPSYNSPLFYNIPQIIT